MRIKKMSDFSALFEKNNLDFSFDQSDKCAVVGNGGILSGSGYGDEINSHDCIIRMNHAETEGFEEDVASRTTFRILNGPLLKGESQEPMKLPENWIKNLKNENVILGRTTEQGKANGARVLSGKNNLFFPSYKVQKEVNKVENTFDLRHASTGLFSLIMFSMFFDEVGAFGFGFHSEDLSNRHYWESYNEEHDVNHEWGRERIIVKTLENRGLITLYR